MSDTIWIVTGRCGEYSDRREWVVAWCASQEEAERLCAACAADEASLTEDERDEWHYRPEMEASRKAKLRHDPYYAADWHAGTKYAAQAIKRWP